MTCKKTWLCFESSVSYMSFKINYLMRIWTNWSCFYRILCWRRNQKNRSVSATRVSGSVGWPIPPAQAGGTLTSPLFPTLAWINTKSGRSRTEELEMRIKGWNWDFKINNLQTVNWTSEIWDIDKPFVFNEQFFQPLIHIRNNTLDVLRLKIWHPYFYF